MDDTALRTILRSQYHAAMAMLRDAIVKCPDDLWHSPPGPAPCWGVAYHALFFAHAYVSQDQASFRPWDHHQPDVQNPDGIAGPADPASAQPLLPTPYTKQQLLDYWALCDARIDAELDAMDLSRTESGFWRYPIPKLEHQLVNLRHIQHHAAQLAARIRAHADVGIDWVGARRPKAG